MRKKRQREKVQQKEQEKQADIQKRQEMKAFRKKVAGLIEDLGETDGRALLQIDRIIERIGLDFALAKLAETDKIESEGGLMLEDNSRRRTRGGVFFFLVKKSLKEGGRKADLKEIFYKNQDVNKDGDEVESDTQDGEGQPPVQQSEVAA